MENIHSAAGLKLAIQAKRLEHTQQGDLLKEQLLITFDSLKPLSIIKNSLKEITSSPHLIDNMAGALTGIASGYLSNIIAVAGSHNIVRKILGSILQFSVTNVVAQHPEALKAMGKSLIQRLFHKKEDTSDKV